MTNIKQEIRNMPVEEGTSKKAHKRLVAAALALSGKNVRDKINAKRARAKKAKNRLKNKLAHKARMLQKRK